MKQVLISYLINTAINDQLVELLNLEQKQKNKWQSYRKKSVSKNRTFTATVTPANKTKGTKIKIIQPLKGLK